MTDLIARAKGRVKQISTRVIAQGAVVAVLVAGCVGYTTLNKSVVLDVNGQRFEISSFAGTVGDLLADQGVAVADGDVLAPGADTALYDGLEIGLVTAHDITLAVDGEQHTVAAVAASSSGVDRIDAASRSLGQRAELDAEPLGVTITRGGESSTVTTTAQTVRDLLLEQGIVLADDETVAPGLDEELTDGATISIGKLATSTVTTEEVLAHNTVKQDSDTVLKGTEKVQTAGADGKRVTTYQVTTVDGVEVSREPLVSSVTQAPVDEVILVGTKEAPAVVSSGGGSAPATGPVVPGSNRDIGRQLAAARGWGDDQFACLDALWTRESGWNHLAQNRSSGAYGIPQSLPGSKMGSVAADWQTNPATQITWGLGYISGRYGTPCGAWSSFQAKGWY